MFGVILFDSICTLVRQPASYWRNPSSAEEYNRLYRYVMIQGCVPFILLSILYVAGLTFLVSVVPKRLGLTLLFAFTLGHYFGASTWLAYHFGFGTTGVVIYSVALAIILVACGFDTRDGNSFQHTEPNDDTRNA